MMPRHPLPRLDRASPCLEKLDRLGWAVGGSFTGWGAVLGVRATTNVDLAPFLAACPPGMRLVRKREVQALFSYVVGGPGERPGLRRFHVLYENAAVVARSHDPEPIVAAFERRARVAVALLASDPVFVHAGVVAWKGRAILVLGPPEAGKSTLVRELVRLGATYYSDEYALVSADGRVRPFPKPLQLRDPGSGEPRTEAVPAGQVGRRPVRVCLVLSSRFRAGATFRPRRISRARGVLEMLRGVARPSRLGRRIFGRFGGSVARALVLRGARGEADIAARTVLEIAEQATRDQRPGG